MALKRHGEPVQSTGEQGFSLLQYTPTQLMSLRSMIDQMLGLGSLTDLNIENEILVQLQNAKLLAEEVRNDSDVPANQKAQTINSVSSILKQLVGMQTELYNAERLKEIEAAVIEALKPAPKEIQDSFFERYERLLTGKAVS
jgi:galactose-1-phosphate uridylyltransferase